MPIPPKLQKHLDGHQAAYQPVRHRTVYTAYDLAQTLRHDLAEIVKTLLIKTEQGMKLVVLPASKRLDLVKLKKALGVKKATIASEKDMQKHYKVQPGAIHAFGSLLQSTPVVVDKTLTKAKELVFPTGSFTDSLRMKVKQYLSLENPMIANFTEGAGLKLTAKKHEQRSGKGKKRGAVRAKKRTTKKRTR